MKKRHVGCLGLLFVGVLFYAGWVMYPPARYTAQVDEIVKRFDERNTKEQQLAKEQENNAYLDPLFLPFWGRKDLESKPENEVQPVMDAVDPYCDLSQGKETDLEGLMAKGETKPKEAFAKYAAFYPSFEKMLSKPNFLVPYDSRPDLTALVPNYIRFRSLVQHNGAYAEYLALSGKTDEGLKVAGDSLLFSRKMDEQLSPLITRMISVACRAISQQTALMVLQTGKEPPSAAALERFLRLLEQTQLPATELNEPFEVEFYAANNLFDKMKQNQELNLDPSMDFGALARIPGLLNREIRLFQNDYIPLLGDLKEGRESDLSWAGDLSFWTWFSGSHGAFSAIAIPNFYKAKQHQELLEEKQSFLHLYASLILASVQDGKWPATIKALEESGYKPLPGLDLTKVQYKIEGKKMSLTLEHPNHEILSTQTTSDPELSEWESLAGETWKVESTIR